eukprot:8658529-Alexandrium_andersonii.AAC.1
MCGGLRMRSLWRPSERTLPKHVPVLRLALGLSKASARAAFSLQTACSSPNQNWSGSNRAFSAPFCPAARQPAALLPARHFAHGARARSAFSSASPSPRAPCGMRVPSPAPGPGSLPFPG